MSKTFEPLSLNKETKISYVSNPQTNIESLQISKIFIKKIQKI